MATVAATCCCAAIAATALLLVTCNVPAMCMATQTVPFVSRYTTDILMDSGDGVPIYKGDTLRLDILRLAGRDSSEYLMMNLIEREYSFSATSEREIVRIATETLCYVFRLRHRGQIDRGATHKELYAIVVLTVGTTMFKGCLGAHDEWNPRRCLHPR